MMLRKYKPLSVLMVLEGCVARLVRFHLVFFALIPAATVLAEDTMFAVGDCVVFREGGAGRLLKAPTYWMKGHVAGVVRENRVVRRCPHFNKPISAYSRQDWALAVVAMPCVDDNEVVQEISVSRIRLTVEDWETPWSSLHGTTGQLFRGQYLDQLLRKGGEIEIDAYWLVRCDS